MARLKDFRTDTHALTDGVWIRVNESLYGDLEIMARGFTDDFVDARNARMKKAAKRYGQDETQIPNAELRDINASLLRDFLLMNVRNLEGDDGNPVPFVEFSATLTDPSYSQLAKACWDAAIKVSSLNVEELEDAVGNSQRPSRSNANGEASAPD